MADAQTRNIHGIVDKRMPARRTRTNPQATAFAGDTKDIAAMRARLATVNAAYYTTERLNAMTVNDLIFAIRRNDEAGSI